MRLRRKRKPTSPPIRLVPNSHAGRSGYDAYVEGRGRVAWARSPIAAAEAARLALIGRAS